MFLSSLNPQTAKLRNTLKSLLDYSLFRRLLLTFTAVAIIATAAYSYRKIDSELTSLALARREAVAQLLAATLTEKFGRSIDVALSLSTRVHFRNLVAEKNWTEAIKILRDVPDDFPHIERLFLTDVRGTLMADVPALPGVRGVNFASHEWFQGVSRTWRPYISPMYARGATPQIDVIAVAAPVKNMVGQVVGILVMQIRIKNILEWVTGIETGKDGFISIVDSKGQIVFHSKRQDSTGTINLPATAIMQKLRQGGQGVEIGFDAQEQEESIVAYAPIPVYGWGVIVQQPVRSSLGLAARDALLRQLLTGYGLILLLSIAAIFLTARMSSARRRGAAESLRSRIVFENLFVSLPGLYLVITPDLNIVAVSDAYLKATMTKREEITGRNLFDVFPDNPGDPTATGTSNLRASLDRVLKNAAADTMAIQKYDVRRPDGTFEVRYWSPINSPVFGVDRRIEYIIHRVEDVTDFIRQKSQPTGSATEMRDRMEQMEAEIFLSSQKVQAANQQLNAANHELEAFSYSVSHDLRAPLRSMDGFSQALLDDYSARLDDKGKDYLKRMRVASQRMGQLIDDMLTLSRVTRSEMLHEIVDLGNLAVDAFSELQKNDPGRKVDWRIGTGLFASGDARLLHMMLVNLLSNAWKYTARQPQPRIEFDARRNSDGNPEFFVRDNGVGFDMAYADKLFGAFQRLHTSVEFPGTGVGLAIVQRIIHRHGGQIHGVGVPDQGATFYFTLPG